MIPFLTANLMVPYQIASSMRQGQITRVISLIQWTIS